MSLVSALVPLELQARLSNRSYWRLRYTDGRIIDEREVDWSLAPTRGRMALQLVCPNGQQVVLGNTQGSDGRLWQLKVAVRGAGAGRQVMAHVVGIINGTDGQTTLYAWEPDPGRLVGPLTDNVFALRYQQIGALSPDVLGLTP